MNTKIILAVVLAIIIVAAWAVNPFLTAAQLYFPPVFEKKKSPALSGFRFLLYLCNIIL